MNTHNQNADLIARIIELTDIVDSAIKHHHLKRNVLTQRVNRNKLLSVRSELQDMLHSVSTEHTQAGKSSGPAQPSL